MKVEVITNELLETMPSRDQRSTAGRGRGTFIQKSYSEVTRLLYIFLLYSGLTRHNNGAVETIKIINPMAVDTEVMCQKS